MNDLGILRVDGSRRAVRFERRFLAPVEEVWDALTHSERLTRWLAPGTIDARVGGVVSLDFGEGGLVTGRVLRCQPPFLLELEWRFTRETESVVRFELSRDGDETHLILDHRALAPEHATGYGAGWHAHLASLNDHLGGSHGSWDKRFAAALPRYRDAAAALRGSSLP